MNDRVKKLGDYSDNEVPEEMIKEIIYDSTIDLHDLILPFDKKIWTNCVYVISHYPKDRLINHLEDLLVWLQDMNWPGSHEICDLLSTFSDEELQVPLESVLNKAILTNDLCWGYWLKLFIDDYGYSFEFPHNINFFIKSIDDNSC